MAPRPPPRRAPCAPHLGEQRYCLVHAAAHGADKPLAPGHGVGRAREAGGGLEAGACTAATQAAAASINGGWPPRSPRPNPRRRTAPAPHLRARSATTAGGAAARCTASSASALATTSALELLSPAPGGTLLPTNITSPLASSSPPPSSPPPPPPLPPPPLLPASSCGAAPAAGRPRRWSATPCIAASTYRCHPAHAATSGGAAGGAPAGHAASGYAPGSADATSRRPRGPARPAATQHACCSAIGSTP
jgi:hypothetical protein